MTSKTIAIVDKHLNRIAVLLANDATWHTDVQKYIDGSRTRGLPSGTCIYFAQHEDEPGVIKIGMTKDLRSRMRQFKNQTLSRTVPILICIAQTNEHALFEAILHQLFRRHLSHHEWYDESTVYNWLAEFTSVVVQS